MVSGLFLSRQSTARHAVVANGLPPIRVDQGRAIRVVVQARKHVLGSRGAAARGHIKCSELYSTFCLRRKDDCQVLNKGDYFDKLKRAHK